MNAVLRSFGWVALAAWMATGTPTRAQGISLGDALDAPDWTWTTNATGYSMWQTESSDAHDGVDMVRGYADSFENIWIETTVTGPGAVSFWWRSAIHYSSSFNFSINGELQAQCGDYYVWKNQICILGEGQQSLR